MSSVVVLERMLFTMINLKLVEQAYVAEDSLISGKWYAYVRCGNMDSRHRKLHVISGGQSAGKWWTT